MDVGELDSYVGNANFGFWKWLPGEVNMKWPVFPVRHCRPDVGVEGSFDKAIMGVRRLIVNPFMVGYFDARERSTPWLLYNGSQLSEGSLESFFKRDFP